MGNLGSGWDPCADECFGPTIVTYRNKITGETISLERCPLGGQCGRDYYVAAPKDLKDNWEVIK